jgi:hypothetical protein
MDESSDALDSAVLSAEFFKRINGGDLDMGLNSIMGQGIIGNAANSLMGTGGMSNGAISNAQQAQWNAAQLAQSPMVTKSSHPYKENKPRLSMNVNIVQADNGFIVNVGEMYTGTTPHIAATIEDVCAVITSQLASRMLERVE